MDGPDSIYVYLPTSHEKRPLARLPSLPDHAAKEWSGKSTAWDLQHWIQAAIALDPEGAVSRKTAYRDDLERVHLETKMDIMWLPGEEGGTDLKLLLTVDVLVNIDNLVKPLVDVGVDMVGLILHSLMPAPVTPYLTESEARAEQLRHFFDSLQPAPDHSITFNVNRLQPEEMKCQLLPFQKRTLGLLLRREGATMMQEKEEKSDIRDPNGFWSVWDLEGVGRMAYRRSTGTLVRLDPIKVDKKGKGKAIDEEDIIDGLLPNDRKKLPTLLDLSGVKGTMLCEEMGEQAEVGQADARSRQDG